jgi:hypothetical protein
MIVNLFLIKFLVLKVLNDKKPRKTFLWILLTVFLVEAGFAKLLIV